MRTALTVLFFFIALWGAASAAEGPSQVDIPDPTIFLDEDSISIAVLQARPEDAGFRSLLKTAWSAMNRGGAGQMSPFLSTLFRFLQGSRAEEPLTTFLPVQAVRVDRMGEDGAPQPTIAVSVSGWAGLQSLYYTGLVTQRDGTPYPTEEVHGETIFLRNRWQDPTKAALLTRVRGTFLKLPSLDQARRVIGRMYEKRPTAPRSKLLQAFGDLNQQSDTYGVLVNQERSLLEFLYWLNRFDMRSIEHKVGKERLEQVGSHIRQLSWEGDLVTDDQMDFTARFETDTPEAREELKKVLVEARDVLAVTGRAGNLQINSLGNRVIVGFTMLGYRQAMLSYLNAAR